MPDRVLNALLRGKLPGTLRFDEEVGVLQNLRNLGVFGEPLLIELCFLFLTAPPQLAYRLVCLLGDLFFIR